MNKLLWIDLEMTGLDVEKEVIIEAAAVITDLEFKHLGEYHAIVKQDQKYLDGMDEWNTQHHGESGLTAAVPNGKEPDQVESDLIQLVEEHFTDERPVLAGNSIHQDKLFIHRHFKKLASRLHYRMLDVSSFKIIFNNKFNKIMSKKTTHRALDDIYESIDELKYYMSFITP